MESDNQAPKQLVPYLWKKGQSGNPNGRPPGKTLKEFAREYLLSLPDEEKIEYLASLPPEITWKMAEGLPQQDITSGGKPLPQPIYGGLSGHDGDKEDIQTEQAN